MQVVRWRYAAYLHTDLTILVVQRSRRSNIICGAPRCIGPLAVLGVSTRDRSANSLPRTKFVLDSGVTMGWLLRLVTGAPLVVGGPRQFYFILNQKQWCIAENGGGYMQRGVPKGLKVPCLFMIAEVSIRCGKKTRRLVYTVYPRIPPVHH